MNIIMAPRCQRIVSLSLFLLLAASSRSVAEDWQTLATNIATDLSAKRFDSVEARFDARMAAALPTAQLAATWTALLAQVGAFGSVTGTREEDQGAYHIVIVTCSFARASLDVKLAFDGERKVAGMFFLPSHASGAATNWSPPPYARPSDIHERALVVGSEPWTLPGILTTPSGKGPFPAVVLVQGSGPQDEDETIGPNKPFKDLAWGLASRGVATLRFPKRTQVYPTKIDLASGTFTVAQESVDDARAAIELVARQPEIDARRIFVLGHSLGGTLAPRIAKGEPSVAGLILLAGGVRPLPEAVVEQFRYLASLHTPGIDAATIAAAEQSAREAASSKLTPTSVVSLAGAPVPGSYFLDLRGYDPPRAAAALKLPVLALQGERDYQVTTTELAAWKAALAPIPHSAFKVYPNLYHLFMPSTTPGTGFGTPGDYAHADHVVEQVIVDIATWIASVPEARK